MHSVFLPYDGPKHIARDGDMLVLIQLKAKQRDIYMFLAEAQDTKFAVVPFHTETEFEAFHKAVSIGGQWCPTTSTPNFDDMVKWWSGIAQGSQNKIFYKLREHLVAYWHFRQPLFLPS